MREQAADALEGRRYTVLCSSLRGTLASSLLIMLHNGSPGGQHIKLHQPMPRVAKRWSWILAVGTRACEAIGQQEVEAHGLLADSVHEEVHAGGVPIW